MPLIKKVWKFEEGLRWVIISGFVEDSKGILLFKIFLEMSVTVVHQFLHIMVHPWENKRNSDYGGKPKNNTIPCRGKLQSFSNLRDTVGENICNVRYESLIGTSLSGKKIESSAIFRFLKYQF